MTNAKVEPMPWEAPKHNGKGILRQILDDLPAKPTYHPLRMKDVMNHLKSIK